jgi:hypothetical protein
LFEGLDIEKRPVKLEANQGNEYNIYPFRLTKDLKVVNISNTRRKTTNSSSRRKIVLSINQKQPITKTRQHVHPLTVKNSYDRIPNITNSHIFQQLNGGTLKDMNDNI